MLELLAVVDQREITSLLLDVNDDINNHMLRYERYNNNTEKQNMDSEVAGISTDDVVLLVPVAGALV